MPVPMPISSSSSISNSTSTTSFASLKILASFFLVTALTLALLNLRETSHSPVHGQAKVSNQPQTRYTATAVTAGQLVISAACPAGQGIPTTELCVTQATGTGPISGVAITSCSLATLCQIMMTGVSLAQFDSQPVLGDYCLVAGPVCHDVAGSGSGLGGLFSFLNTQGVVGRITGLSDSSHAWITMYHPGAVGYAIAATTFDSATVPAYIQANQTVQANSDWTAGSGVAKILNEPTLATVATSGSYSDLSNKPMIPAAQVNSDWLATSGLAQVLNKPTLAAVATTGAYSSLTGTPTLATVATTGLYSDLLSKPTIPTTLTINTVACTLNSSCVIPVGGAGTVTSFSAGTWPTWLTPAVTTATTTPVLAVAASAIPNSALANSSVTVSGQTCTLGSTCTIPSATTSLETCTVTQTAIIAIGLGPRTVAVTCTGVVSGGYYFLAETAASLTAYPGYGVFAGGTGTAANTLQVTLYAPLLAIGGNYTITFAVWKMN